MPDPAPVTAETLSRMSRELHLPTVTAEQMPAVVEMLNGLASDMAESRQFQAGEAEPAMIYIP